MKCRKRHLLVDTLGLVLTVVVPAADIQDRDGATLVLKRIKKYFYKMKALPLAMPDKILLNARMEPCAVHTVRYSDA